jgi:chromosome segregation ATPase
MEKRSFREVVFDWRMLRQNPTKTAHGTALEINRAFDEAYKRIAEVEENNRRQIQGMQIASKLAGASTDLTPILSLISSLEKDLQIYAADAKGVEKLEKLKKTFLENRANNLKEVGQELSSYILQPFENFLVSVEEANKDRKQNRVGSMLSYTVKAIAYVAIPAAFLAGSVMGVYSLPKIKATEKKMIQMSAEFDKKADLFNKRSAQYSAIQESQDRRIEELATENSELVRKLKEAESGLAAVNSRLDSTDSSVLTLYEITDNLMDQHNKLSAETQGELRLVNSRLNSVDSSVLDLQTTNGSLIKKYEKLVADNSFRDARFLKLGSNVDDLNNSVKQASFRIEWLTSDYKYLQERLDSGYSHSNPSKILSLDDSSLRIQVPNEKTANPEEYRLIKK